VERSLTSYDRLDWHVDSAVEAGEPPENGFTHIGLYLAWLIRHDLHDPELFPPDHINAVKRGEMTGSDLADDIDTKLLSMEMTTEGAAFSDARYADYLDAYGEVFSDQSAYSVVDDAESYAIVEPLIDGLYQGWIDAGRPKPEPKPELDEDDFGPTAVRVMVPPDFPEEEAAELRSAFAGDDVEFTTAGDMVLPHAAPDLEEMVRTGLALPPIYLSSVLASEWGSSLLTRALKRLDIRAKDAIVASGLAGDSADVLSISLYRVPGIAADRLVSEFEAVVVKPRGAQWEVRRIAGRDVRWAANAEATISYWAVDGLVIHVGGEGEKVDKAIARLP
jgi:hypothetical protein